MFLKNSCGAILVLAGVLAGPLYTVPNARAQTVASPFIDHHEQTKSRLLAARHEGRLYAFIEIAMPEGWKTYWRNPGDAGGLPPTFDFSESENLAAARVRLPAPKRLTDRAGDTIGYKGRALFPVEIDAVSADKPVLLKLAGTFGVCREICVPVDASHDLTIDPVVVGEADEALVAAIAAVPRPAEGNTASLTARIVTGATPNILFEAAFPTGGSDADLFVEAPDGLYVPMVKRTGEGADGKVQFTSTFSSEAELKQLVGKLLTVTLVDQGGGVETQVTASP